MRLLFVLVLFVLAAFALPAIGQRSSSPQLLCQKVKNIKELPRDWGEKGVDKTYDEIVAAGYTVIPCLIDNLTNVVVMRDPRCPTISTATTIGDISYFLLVDMLKLELTELLPDDVKADFKTTGVYAYQEYVTRKGARKELQMKLRKWYADNKGK